MSLVARYRELLGTGGAAAALIYSVIGRLSLGMTGLAILLLVRASTGSYAAAGAVSAAYAIAFAVASPSRARTADRQGPVRVLLLCAVAHPVALVLLALLAERSAPVLLLAAIAVGAGATVPPLGSVMRALWGQVAHGPALATAYSLDAVAVELCFVIGPGLTALTVAVSGPTAAMLTSAVLTLVGGVGLARCRAVGGVRPHPDAVHSLAGPLSSGTVLALLLTVVWVGMGFGAIEIAMPAFAEAHGSRPATAGILLAIWAFGSMIGGLLYGGLAPSRPPIQQLPWLVTALAIGGSLPLLAQGPVTMALALFGYGLTIAPYFSCNSWLLGEAAPAGTTTEAFAWNSSMIFGGAAIGTGLGGALAESSGPTAALAVASVAGLLSFVTSLSGRRRIQRVTGG